MSSSSSSSSSGSVSDSPAASATTSSSNSTSVVLSRSASGSLDASGDPNLPSGNDACVPIHLRKEYKGGCCGKGALREPMWTGAFTRGGQHERPRHIGIVVNPVSGKKRGLKILERVQPVFERAGVQVTVLKTQHAGHATEIAANANGERPDDLDALVALGGDGTFHEVINGLLQASGGEPVELPVGLIPGGTGNSIATDLLHDVGGADPVVAAEIIRDGMVRSMDCGLYVGPDDVPHYFANLVTTGLGTDSNATAEKLRWLGPMRYDVGALWRILRMRSYAAKVTIDGTVFEGEFPLVAVQNNQHAGNKYRMAPAASLDDGYLDVVFGTTRAKGKLINLLGQLDKGTHVMDDEIQYYKFKRLTYEPASGREVVNIDGENVGVAPFTVSVVPRALRMFCHV